jgi:hypothetical protein
MGRLSARMARSNTLMNTGERVRPSLPSAPPAHRPALGRRTQRRSRAAWRWFDGQRFKVRNRPKVSPKDRMRTARTKLVVLS